MGEEKPDRLLPGLRRAIRVEPGSNADQSDDQLSSEVISTSRDCLHSASLAQEVAVSCEGCR